MFTLICDYCGFEQTIKENRQILKEKNNSETKE